MLFTIPHTASNLFSLRKPMATFFRRFTNRVRGRIFYLLSSKVLEVFCIFTAMFLGLGANDYDDEEFFPDLLF